MARPQAADYDDRRRAILSAAAELFARDGFHGCSIADIARDCGISKSLLYHYFVSKEDMLFGIMDEHIEALRDVSRGIAGFTGASDRLTALTHGFLRLYEGASHQHKVLVNDLDRLPAARRADIVAKERELVETVAVTLAKLSPDLARSPARSRAAAMLYFGMINWTHTWYDPNGELGIGELAELVVQTTLSGVAGPSQICELPAI